MSRTLLYAGLALLGALVVGLRATAHETDQFTVPAGKMFADIGDDLTVLYHDKIEQAVKKANDKIRRAQEAGRDPSYLTYLRDPETLTNTVYYELDSAFYAIESCESMVHSSCARKRFPGRVVGYRESIRNIYQHVHFFLDPRQFWRLWDASTMKVYGTYMGPDKLGHFNDMGYLYYAAYRRALEKGLSREEALEKAVRLGTKGLVLAEEGMLGFFSAGAYSNADLAANYVGMKFYLNLTRATRLKGRMCPPMIERDGDFWRVSPHVRRDSRFFEIFVSDHFNEALNPSLFEHRMRKAVRKAVGKRTERILEFYADDNGNRRPKAYFDDLQVELSTYYGEDYGHWGSYEELITIGNTCFEQPPDRVPARPGSDGAYAAIHWAALTGDTAGAIRLLEDGADAEQVVQSLESNSSEWGNTPLHLAAVAGHADMAQLLLDRGAEVNRGNERGATPLHRAIDHPEVVEILVAGGADVNARDERGRTPLHWLARYPTLSSARFLIARGADVDAEDHGRETPLHAAAMGGHLDLMETLLAAGASVDARANFETTPLHFAVRQSDPRAVELLKGAEADLDAPDEFGLTALHDLARRGRWRLTEVLLAAGADPDARDHAGSTPLHVAVRYGAESVASVLLAEGADVNAVNEAGSMPLHESAFAGRIPLLYLLLDYGADPSAKNINGESALDLASSHGHALAVFLLSSPRSSVQ
ncbi:MAG: ankyrin repeat domain-containing protein [Planctomycetota bacterium]|jgi:ankyrin repeat protein